LCISRTHVASGSGTRKASLLWLECVFQKTVHARTYAHACTRIRTYAYVAQVWCWHDIDPPERLGSKLGGPIGEIGPRLRHGPVPCDMHHAVCFYCPLGDTSRTTGGMLP
jgi:hypothetical protein